ncbi:MAG: nitronate monooxygenase [Variibacter sp.]|jgi:nitronate monooxygenase|nr:nitronate monooxygenase [Variibacter sp.]
MWPDRRLIDLFGIKHPILLAPMAGAMNVDLAVAVAEGGGLAALPCAMLSAEQVREQVADFRSRTNGPINLNFFNHTPPVLNNAREVAWRERLAPFYRELRIDPAAPVASANRRPFDAEMLEAVRQVEPEVISFHYGMPKGELLRELKRLPIQILCSATTRAEAKAVEEQGAHVVIAQGLEAGGHRGTFLSQDPETQVGTFALVPQVVDAVRIPVIAAGGIADGRGIAAAFALGASGVLLGTAYLFTPEAKIAAPFRAALAAAEPETTITNVFTGRLARGLSNRIIREVGPVAPEAPDFPLAAGAVAPLRAAAEKQGSGDFSPMWAGQAVALGRTAGAAELTETLARDALERLRALAAS